MHVRLVAVLVALVAACNVELAVVRCADGTVCPVTLECPRNPGEGCFDPTDHCVGKPAGESCTPDIGGDGTCDGEGVCVPVTCGDGVVQEREICEPSLGPDRSCLDLGYDFGRSACADDCSGSVPATCGYIGWRDLRMFEEPGRINDATLIDGVVWLAGDNGVYRERGDGWERVHPGRWRYIAGSSAEVWAIDDENWQAAHSLDGVAWTVEMLPPVATTFPLSVGFAAFEDGELILGVSGSSASVIRRAQGQWEVTTVHTDPAAFGVGATAYARWGQTELVAVNASGITGFPPMGFYSGSMFRRDGTGPWQPIAWPSNEMPWVRSIAGSSIDDYVVGGEAFDYLLNQTVFRARRVVGHGSGTPTVTAVAGSGLVTSVGDGQLIVPIEPAYFATPADPVVQGTFVQGFTAQRVEIPARANALVSGGGRTVLVVDGAVLELGDAVWSPEPAVVDSSPTPAQRVTEVNALHLTASSDRGRIYVVDRREDGIVRGLVWGVPTTAASPVVTEHTRSIAGMVAAWGDGIRLVGISNPQTGPKASHFNGTSTPTGGEFPLTGTVPRDLAGNPTLDDGLGNVTMDLMVVGGGSTFARWFDGAAWQPATQGLTAPDGLHGVAATGAGTYVAVGDGGLLARYGSGSWQPQATGTTQALYAVDSLGGQTVAVGDRVAVRCDASTCAVDPLPTAVRNVALEAADDVFAVGGDALHFDGVSWNRIRLGRRASRVEVRGSSVWFADPAAGGGVRRLVRVRSWR